MPALDTNVLVRYLVRDDAVQAAAAEKLIRRALADGQTLFMPVSVALELEWVLRSNFAFARADLARLLSELLAAFELRFESEAALELALSLYKNGTADYSDCVHVALAVQAGERPLWTFDKAASKVEGAQLLRA
jgi:predicted nucleic-acid-binding protein